MSEANLLSKELGKDNYYIRVGRNFLYGGMSFGRISGRVAEFTYRYYVSHGTVKRIYSESAKGDYLLLIASSYKSILFTETAFKTFVRAYGRFYSRQVLEEILRK